MTLDEVREMYPDAPGFSNEIGRFVSASGATYRAWYDGIAQKIDADADQRRYGEESCVTFNWCGA